MPILHNNAYFKQAYEASKIMDKLAIEFARTEFTLPMEVANQCTQHFLRVWEGGWVHGQIEDGKLITSDAEWIVHWASTPEIVKNAEKVACSFREFKGVKYVVIKVWNTGNKE